MGQGLLLPLVGIVEACDLAFFDNVTGHFFDNVDVVTDDILVELSLFPRSPSPPLPERLDRPRRPCREETYRAP